MKKSVIAAVLLVLVGLPATYVAMPFWTAWSIREAIKTGDTGYLARKVDFASVRQTLGPSLVNYAFDMPDPDAAEPAKKPGLWKRVKAYWGGAAVNRMIDKYVTADGLPKLFQMRRSYREATGSGVPETDKPALLIRMKAFYKRVIRAEFKSVTEFEVEMRDQYDEARRHTATLKLRGFDWILVSASVRQIEFNDASEDARFDPVGKQLPNEATSESGNEGDVAQANVIGPNIPSSLDR